MHIQRPFFFYTSKAGNSDEEYEDSFTFWPRKRNMLKGLFCCAAADGTSEAVLSGKWASFLVKGFCKYQEDIRNFNMGYFLNRRYKVWGKWINQYRKWREANRPIQWYEEPGLQTGAFSTFLGFAIIDEPSKDGKCGTWKAVAIGDTCLFQIREDKLIIKFPVEHSSDFNNQPDLISSNPDYNKDILLKVKELCGDCYANDQFFIMTDALSCWFLKEYEAGEKPWKKVEGFRCYENQSQSIVNWIDELRLNKQIRNDDITLIHIIINSGK